MCRAYSIAINPFGSGPFEGLFSLEKRMNEPAHSPEPMVGIRSEIRFACRLLQGITRGARMSAYGTKQTCSMRRRMSASGGKTDVDQPLLTSLDLCVHALACLLIYDKNGYQQRRSSDRLAVVATKLRHDLAGVFLRESYPE